MIINIQLILIGIKLLPFRVHKHIPELCQTVFLKNEIVQFSSITQSCLTLFDPKDCSMPGFPVHLQLPELDQTHVHGVGDAIQPSLPVIPFSSCPQSFPTSGSFPMSQFFTSGGQSIGASASASVLPISIKDRFPLGLTGLISLQSKVLSRIYSNSTIKNHWF